MHDLVKPHPVVNMKIRIPSQGSHTLEVLALKGLLHTFITNNTLQFQYMEMFLGLFLAHALLNPLRISVHFSGSSVSICLLSHLLPALSGKFLGDSAQS